MIVGLLKIDMVQDFSLCLIHVNALSFTVCFTFASGGLCKAANSTGEGFDNCFGLHSVMSSVDSTYRNNDVTWCLLLYATKIQFSLLSTAMCEYANVFYTCLCGHLAFYVFLQQSDMVCAGTCC